MYSSTSESDRENEENMECVDEVEGKATKRQEIEPQERQLLEDMEKESSPKRSRSSSPLRKSYSTISLSDTIKLSFVPISDPFLPKRKVSFVGNSVTERPAEQKLKQTKSWPQMNKARSQELYITSQRLSRPCQNLSVIQEE